MNLCEFPKENFLLKNPVKNCFLETSSNPFLFLEESHVKRNLRR